MDAVALEFARALISPRASEELEERAADFDWLVGKWSAIVRDYSDDGTVEENEVTAPVIDAFYARLGSAVRASTPATSSVVAPVSLRSCSRLVEISAFSR